MLVEVIPPKSMGLLVEVTDVINHVINVLQNTFEKAEILNLFRKKIIVNNHYKATLQNIWYDSRGFPHNSALFLKSEK